MTGSRAGKKEVSLIHHQVDITVNFVIKVAGAIDLIELTDVDLISSYMSTPSDAHLYNLLEKSIKSVRNP